MSEERASALGGKPPYRTDRLNGRCALLIGRKERFGLHLKAAVEISVAIHYR